MVEHEYTEEIVCPYCGYKYSDSWEYDNEGGELECYECGKTFNYSKDVSVSYSTWSDCEENNEEHNWSEWKYVESNEDVLTKELHEEVNDFYIRECTKCDKQEFISLKDLNKI